MNVSEKAGLFASLTPTIFIGYGEFVGNKVPEKKCEHPLIKLHKETEEPCALFKLKDGTKLFSVECIVLAEDETQHILGAGLSTTNITAQDYVSKLNEVFG